MSAVRFKNPFILVFVAVVIKESLVFGFINGSAYTFFICFCD